MSTPHKFQICLPSQNLILFQPILCLKKGMIVIMRNIKLTIEYDGKEFNRMAKTA